MPRRRHRPPAGNILLLGDPHAPYQHPRTFSFLQRLKAKYHPSRVVFLGDMIDGLTASRFGPQAAAHGADTEHREACRVLRHLAKLFPIADVVWGNHDLRAEKKASEHGIATERIRPINEVPALREPLRSWTWHHELALNRDTVVLHGDGFGGANPGENAVLAYRKNVIMGHLHTRFAINYYSRKHWRNWSMNCGCLANPKAPAASYAIHAVKRPIFGAGVLLEGKIPILEPM